MAYIIGSTAYRNREEALTGEVGMWASSGEWPEVIDGAAVADISAEIRAADWLDESFGEVGDGELADAIRAHDAWVRERQNA